MYVGWMPRLSGRQSPTQWWRREVMEEWGDWASPLVRTQVSTAVTSLPWPADEGHTLPNVIASEMGVLPLSWQQVITLDQVSSTKLLLSKLILETVVNYCTGLWGLKFRFLEMPPSSLIPECGWHSASLRVSAPLIVICHSQLPPCWEGPSVATLVGDCSTLLFSVLLFLLLCLLWVSLFCSTCCLLLWCAASSPSCARVSSGWPSVWLCIISISRRHWVHK